MDAHEFLGGNYLSKDDVPEPVVVTVARAGKHHFEGDSRPKLILSFKELEKPVVCNKTNVNLAANALKTTAIPEWVGKRLVLYSDPNVSFGGRMVGGLRLRGLTAQEQQSVNDATNGGATTTDPDVPF